jgi:histidine phosphotransferase ChpT
MAELVETMRLVDLVCARLCHDLGGLTGTVGNALDMAAEEAGGGGEIVAFAAAAAKALTARLRLMRAAWGPESDAMGLTELTGLARPPLTARRVGLDTRLLPEETLFPASVGRVVLNLIVLAGDCMRKGGTITLMGKPADVLVRIEGPEARWPSGFAACMHDDNAAFAALTGAGSVQMPLTVLLAVSRGLRLSPVLGPDAGIEAVRLETA